MRSFSTVVCVLLLCGGIYVSPGFSRDASYKPKNGFIPDQKTAVAVAEAVLSAIYGNKLIASERPFSAKLVAGVWVVEGSLPESTPNGGVAEIRISKQTGCILRVMHGK
jgi:hypothetical protein